MEFEYSLVDTVIAQKIPLYCDFMEQDFCEPLLWEDDFFDNDDMASLWADDDLYISKEDYDRICQELEEE